VADLTSFTIAVLSARMRILVMADKSILAASGNDFSSILVLLLLLFSSAFSMDTIMLQALFVASHESTISSREKRHFKG